MDVAFYSDGSFEEQNRDTFKVMLADRQRQLLIDKEVIQAIDNALTDSTDDHPGATALAEYQDRCRTNGQILTLSRGRPV